MNARPGLSRPRDLNYTSDISVRTKGDKEIPTKIALTNRTMDVALYRELASCLSRRP